MKYEWTRQGPTPIGRELPTARPAGPTQSPHGAPSGSSFKVPVERKSFTATPTAQRLDEMIDTPQDRTANATDLSGRAGAHLLPQDSDCAHLWVVALTRPRASEVRSAFLDHAPWFDESTADRVHVVVLGDPKLSGDRGLAVFQSLGVDHDDIALEWSGRLDRHGSAESVVAFETKLAADRFGISSNLLPCLIVVVRAGPKTAHVVIPLASWVDQSRAGASKLTEQLRARFEARRVLPELDRATRDGEGAVQDWLKGLSKAVAGELRTLAQHLEAGSPQRDLTETDKRILKELEKSHPKRLVTSALSDRTDIPDGTISPRARELERLGLIDNVRPHGYGLTIPGQAKAASLA
jgi:hypothetical protein